jgi:hypothetical protein
MGKFDGMSPRALECEIVNMREDLDHAPDNSRATLQHDLDLLSDIIEASALLMKADVAARDACSVALQRATLEAEEARGKT